MDKIAILTDLGNILMKAGIRTETLLRIVRFLGGDMAAAEKFLLQGEYEGNDCYYDVDVGREDFHEFWQRLCSVAKTDHHVVSYELFCALYLRPLEPIVEVIEFYQTLQDRFPLIAVSNGDLGSRYIVLDLGIFHHLYFTEVFISAERGMKKPELLSLVKKYLEENGFEPTKCPFVDDQLGMVAAAIQDHGFPGIHFNGRTQPTSLLRSEFAKLGVE